MAYDVVVLGAGLAGLTAARDLAAAGAGVVVLEARDRVGGRLEQAQLGDGRILQLGGETAVPTDAAYARLVAELGLHLVPGDVTDPVELTGGFFEGVYVGRAPTSISAQDRAWYEWVSGQLLALAATVDPGDPWSHPDAWRLDRLSVADWLKEIGAPSSAVRMKEVLRLGIGGGSSERTSLLAALRRVAGTAEPANWRGLRVLEGAAAVTMRMADELGRRVLLNRPVRSIVAASRRCRVTLGSGECLDAAAVICAIPLSALRDVVIDGISTPRLDSLRRQRQARAASITVAYDRSFWRELGLSGVAECGSVLGAIRPQEEGVLGCVVPSERIDAYLAAPSNRRVPDALTHLARVFGPKALTTAVTVERLWCTDPWTQGGAAQWSPGDLTAVGPLHGTHEPPFYLCGSDHWIADSMEGAVRTARAAARTALAHG